MALINAVERTRLDWLMSQVTTHGGAKYLTASEHKELLHLLQIAGLIPDTPLESVPGQPISGRSAQRRLDELRAGWHNPPISGKAAQLELLRLRGLWYLTPHQAAVQRMRQSWI